MKVRAPPGRSLPWQAGSRGTATGGPRLRPGRLRATREATRMIGEDVRVQLTETDQLRQQLLQAQKLSSVGALASSVAHEFNNILTTIINYTRLAMRPSSDEAGRAQALEK